MSCRPALEQIVKMPKVEPRLNICIVGHTDNVVVRVAQ